MTILTPLPRNDAASNQSRSRLIAIFSAVGKCRVLDEKHFDIATALAGSGPAFACVFLEAMADGAVMMGMPRKEALELAAQSEFFLSFGLPAERREKQQRTQLTLHLYPLAAMQGAARMVIQSGMHPAAIKDSVTSESYIMKDFVQQNIDLFLQIVLCSTGWVYNSWSLDAGRWAPKIDSSSNHSGGC
jgi:pyrroline-5-carboxylate reductase